MLTLDVGGEPRTAVYDAAQGGPRLKVFRYTVQPEDSDSDGVSVSPGSIVLPTGASIRDPRGLPVRLEHKGLFWQARIDTYPFNACRRLTREAARRRAVARARYLRGGGLRALLDAHRQGSILTVL